MADAATERAAHRAAARSGSSRSSRRRASKRPALQGRAGDDGPRRRGQGDADADRGPARSGLRVGGARRAGRRGDGHRSTALGLALTTDSFVVKPIRFPGGSIGELAVNGTVNDLAVAGRSAARAEPRRWSSRRGSTPTSCGPRSRRSRRRPRRPGWRSSPATRRWSSAATADAMYICTTGVGPASTRARASRRRRSGPATGCWSRGTIGEHGTAIMLARGELGLDAEIDSDTRSLWPAVDALLDAAGRGAALHARRDPRRRRVGAQRARPRLRGLDRRPRGRRARCARRSPAPPSSWASTRCTSPTRACSSPSSRPRPRDAALAALRSVPGCERRRRDRRGPDRAAGDGARRHGLRRPAGDGPAGRRPAAEDLLR